MKENISITGNETIEELVKKVNRIESIDDKLSVCIMIITHLEMKNGVRPGSYNHTIGLSKEYSLQDPEERKKMFSRMGTSDRKLDIMTFLYLIKKSDRKCYLELIDKYSRLSKMDGRKEIIITWSVIGVFIIIVYFLLTSF
tara:strand:+ start:1039 stop:1461 length:423 start_codon:yes stop_codon:yes gene_type:complete